MIVEILQVFDSIDIHDMLALSQSARRRGSSRRRFLRSLDEFAPRILASFGLGRVAAGYVEDLSRTHPINLQFSTEKLIKGRKNSVKRQKTHTSVRGCDLLKASMPKFSGMVDFFFKEVTAQTPSSISASLGSSEENRVRSQRLV
jgi:hypothetical protein